MNPADFLPVLSQYDVDRAIQLIQQAYSLHGAQTSPEDQHQLQQELFDIQKRPEAWGLVVPFLEHQEPSVQFFGAHTVQVKIARDWDSFPQENALQLRDGLLSLIVHSIRSKRGKVVLRKLYVSLASLALKLVPGGNSQWPDWIPSSINFLANNGATPEDMLELLSIIAEEIETADLIKSSEMQMRQSLLDAAPMVVEAVKASVTQPRDRLDLHQFNAALKCLQAWISVLSADDILMCIPLLISLLAPSLDATQQVPEFHPEIFVPASETLQEVMTQSLFSGGQGTATLTNPILLWLNTWGGLILQSTLQSGSVNDVSKSLCKLIVALGDHSNVYLASKISSTSHIQPPESTGIPLGSHTLTYLIQNFLQLLLGYTGLPGYYGVDEEESEMTLAFWYLFQESLWSVEYDDDDGEGNGRPDLVGEKEHWKIVKAVYSELVRILKRKVTWPEHNSLTSWSKDEKEKFQVYRRDVGDTLINAYYILRNDMLAYYLDEIERCLSTRHPSEGWEEVEAILHCIMSMQEAIPVEDNPYFTRLFGPQVLGQMPTIGTDRVRRTMLSLIGTYATWFTTQTSIAAPNPSIFLLMNAVSYVVTAISTPNLSLPAANALRDLCDANRAALAPHIGAFAELYAGLSDIPDMERSKVLQSIASVIQALPPDQEIVPLQALTTPVVQKLSQVLHSSSLLPEEARSIAIAQIQTLTGLAKGLTRSVDPIFVLDESAAEEEEVDRIQQAREDPRMRQLREDIFAAVRTTMELWSPDSTISDTLSDLFRAITSLPMDTTLISLPPGPLLELVCFAAQRHLTAVWLSLAQMLITQLNPSTMRESVIKQAPNEESNRVISFALPSLLQTALTALSQPGALADNPDIVQAFFGCLETTAVYFVQAFYDLLPPGAFDALMQCSISALALQERYSLVSSCKFLSTLIRSTANSDTVGNLDTPLLREHGRAIAQAILFGIAGVTPRSVTVNLIELLTTLIARHSSEMKAWVNEILFAEDFIQSKATADDKAAFLKIIMSTRSPRRAREAAQQFALVARGLQGSSFGYASVSI